MTPMSLFVAMATGARIAITHPAKSKAKAKPRTKSGKTRRDHSRAKYKKHVVYYEWRSTGDIAKRAGVSSVSVNKFLRNEKWVECRHQKGTATGKEWRKL